MLDNQQVAENIEKARIRIAEYCKRCNRTEKPLLLAATKTVPVEQINFVIRECGITDIGENRVQELLEKYDSLDKSVRLHFIGRLQRNKVKYIIDKVCMIQSADSLPLIEEIEKQAAKIDKVIPVLVEINISMEPNKTGIPAGDCLSFVKTCREQFPHIDIQGLMCVGPNTDDQAAIEECFEQVHQLYLQLQEEYGSEQIRWLSMGMSADWKLALAHGSNMVRIGSSIFGPRDYSPKEIKE